MRLSAKLTIILYAIFILSTVALMVIIYKDIDSPLAFKFVIGYLIFLGIFLLYLFTLTAIKMKKLKWIKIRKRLFKFLFWFVLLVVSNYIIRIVAHRPSKGLIGDLANPFGFALGFAFLNVIFDENEDNY